MEIKNKEEFVERYYMGRMVAIAGGDLLSTRLLNIHAIKLSKKINPNVLFIGTASQDAKGYIEVITKEYTVLGCAIKSLCLVTDAYSDNEIDTMLSWADIIYVGGGDTIFMMQTWKQFGLDKKLKKIYEQDLAVLTGISAGAIGMYEQGRREPPLDIIVKLSAIFGVTTDYLLTGEIRNNQDISMILDSKWDRYLLLVAALLADKYKES